MARKVVFKLNWLKNVDNNVAWRVVVAMTELLLFQTMWQWLAPVNMTIVFLAMLGARLVWIRCQVQGLDHFKFPNRTFSWWWLSFTYFTRYYSNLLLENWPSSKMITLTALEEQCSWGIVHHFISSQFEVSWCNISGPVGRLHLCFKHWTLNTSFIKLLLQASVVCS